RNHGPCLRGQPVDPLTGGDRLSGAPVGAQGGPVALALDRLIGDRALDDEYERIEPALVGLEPVRQEVVTDLVSQHGIVQVDLGQTRDGAQDDILEAWLAGSGSGDRVAIATQSCGDPEDVYLTDGGGPLGLSPIRAICFCHRLFSPAGERANRRVALLCLSRQQMRGSCSPDSMETPRSPPTTDSRITMPT